MYFGFVVKAYYFQKIGERHLTYKVPTGFYNKMLIILILLNNNHNHSHNRIESKIHT